MIHHTRSKIKVKWKKNIDRYILFMKNASENLKALFKKISIILALFLGKNKRCF